VLARTRRLWEKQDQHVGDRQRLFTAVAATLDATNVLYPRSFVDLAASFVWASVTSVDLDRRARLTRASLHAEGRGAAYTKTPFASPGARRLVVVWALSVFSIIGAVLGGLVAFVAVFTTFMGLVLAVSTQFEAAWIGSPIRPWTLYSIPIALSGIMIALVVL
jgi:hypothetical protein